MTHEPKPQKTKKPIICDDCGTDKDVKQTICPFQDDVYGKRVKVKLCDKCYHERCMDI